jgi:hypothetical protein
LQALRIRHEGKLQARGIDVKMGETSRKYKAARTQAYIGLGQKAIKFGTSALEEEHNA